MKRDMKQWMKMHSAEGCSIFVVVTSNLVEWKSSEYREKENVVKVSYTLHRL